MNPLGGCGLMSRLCALVVEINPATADLFARNKLSESTVEGEDLSFHTWWTERHW
jgi:hypothetical protein